MYRRFKTRHLLCNFQEKESLITELRKELRVSDEEHRELLSRVNADDMIRRIRFDYMVSQGNISVQLCFLLNIFFLI